MASELWVITCYFNPSRYQTKHENYERFIAGLDEVGANYRVVECAFGNAPFELPSGAHILRLRASDIMWQKERLLNLAIAALPRACTKIAWLDCDLLFEDPAWFERTAAALEDVPALQPFETVVRLLPGQIQFCGQGECYAGFGALHNARRESLAASDFERHGHTGFAWAGRREWMEDVGLYDACLTGNGDHLIAHALAGDMGVPCVDRAFGRASRFRDHFELWAANVDSRVRGQIGFVPGRLLHLWHGSVQNRQYSWQDEVFQTFDFDPLTDIGLEKGGAWAWKSSKPAMHDWASRFFDLRLEDATVARSGLESSAPSAARDRIITRS